MAELKSKQQIRLTNNSVATIVKELGRGGQGTVYLIETSGKKMALKWYHQNPGREFYNNLANNIRKGAPAPNFLWPLALTEVVGNTFGYVMELRPSGYEDMNEFLLLRTRFANVHAQLRACLQICAAFQKLHRDGLSYQDMNDGNFFINPKTGDVLICDNDNVVPNGTNTGIKGTPGYLAPEIVEGVKMPNRYTDYHSLAVCLFLLIYMNHPFVGKWYHSCPCDNNPNMERILLGFSAVFIMDPANSKNRPVPGMDDNVIRRWPIYPNLLAKAFCKTFGREAINDPTQRLMAKQWYNILLQIRSMYTKCPHCGKETFIDVEKNNEKCIYCGKAIPTPMALSVGRFTIPLVDGQKIYKCTIADESDIDAIAGVATSKRGTLYLKNLSNITWTVMLPDGQDKVIEKGKSFAINRGYKIRFGQGEKAEII